MTIVYPDALDLFTTIPSGTHQIDTVGARTHREQHNDLGDAIEVIEYELGVYGSGVAGLSPLLNGGFDIWQDGTSFSSVANGTWLADQWIYRKSGAGVHDCALSTDVPTVAQATTYPTNSLHADVTTADTSIAAGDFYTLATRIEGYAFRPFDSQAWTIGFWVKAAKTGRHYVYATNSGNDRSACWPYDIAAANTWEYHTAAFAAAMAPGGTWNYDNGRGVEIGWTLAAGATYHSPSPQSWQVGQYFSGSDQVNELDSTANNFRIALVGRPTVGLAAARFRHADPGLELYRCRRYNEVQGGVANSVFGVGLCTSTTLADFRVPMVPKRAAAPSFGALSGTIGNLSVFAGPAGPVALTAISDLSGGAESNFIRGTVASGLTAGQGAMLFATGTEKLRMQSRIP